MYLRVGNTISCAHEQLHETSYRALSACEKSFYLANLLVDSDDLTFTVEDWDPEHQPQQRLYDSPMFGQCADVKRYRARGWARLVGIRNYALFGASIRQDLLTKPELVETPKLCASSWDWMWQLREGPKLALLAKTDPEQAFGQLVGWPNKIEKRLAYYKACRTFLGVTA